MVQEGIGEWEEHSSSSATTDQLYKEKEEQHLQQQSNPNSVSSLALVPRLSLTLCEAFYCQCQLDCLSLSADSILTRSLSPSESWHIYSGLNNRFPYLYPAYKHFKLTSTLFDDTNSIWHIKDGTSFGCDFLLYRKNTTSQPLRHSHAQ